MRLADRQECAAFGLSPKPALRRSLQASSIALTALVDQRPAAMFGLEVRSAIEGLGAPWMLATEEAYRCGRDLVRLGPAVLDAFSDSTPRMEGIVGSGNERAIRVLRRWGFDVGSDETVIGGLAFVRFRKVR